MYTSLTKNLTRIASEFSKLGVFSKNLIKYGAQAFLALFALGTLFVVLNHTIYNYDMYMEFIARSIIGKSFMIFAEVIIGALVIDFMAKKK